MTAIECAICSVIYRRGISGSTEGGVRARCRAVVCLGKGELLPSHESRPFPATCNRKILWSEFPG
jgi:hypothetical protein